CVLRLFAHGHGARVRRAWPVAGRCATHGAGGSVAETLEPALHRGRRPVVGAALVLGAASLWATFGIFAKVLYDAGFEPVELASVRAAVGFIAVLILALPRIRTIRVPARALPFFAAYGVLGFALFGLIFFAALERT